MAISPAERFWSKVAIGDGCGEWQGACHDGYGAVWPYLGEKTAHRASWTHWFGSIPKGVCVLHKCDNRKCVRPDHLFLGNRTINNKDMYDKGRNVNVRGERVGTSKLREDQVVEILRRHKLGESQHALGRAFCVTNHAIWRIIHGINWKHISLTGQTPPTLASQSEV